MDIPVLSLRVDWPGLQADHVYRYWLTRAAAGSSSIPLWLHDVQRGRVPVKVDHFVPIYAA